MQAKLQELKTSGDDAWGDLKEGLIILESGKGFL